MKRYSTIYGAFDFIGADGKKKNQYNEIGRSAELDTFLKDLRISNTKKAVADTSKFLSGFAELPGYDQQSADDKPMLIRYAPIYLSRRADWGNDILPFCAICGSSPDNKLGGRDGKYYHTHFIARELLLKSADGYNYLDHIFGSPMVTWQEKNAIQQYPVNYDAPPRKITPVLRPLDEMTVKYATAALLTKLEAFKPMKVVLKLERECAFNRRARELLTQIYSLLPPAVAAEIGFASYQHPDTIRWLYKETSIRLFLTHADANTAELESDEVLILDLNQPLEPQLAGFKPIRNLMNAINYWYGMAWADRVQIMEQLFTSVIDPQDGQAYTDTTRAFASDPFWEWKKKMPDRGTIDSLSALKEKYDSFPICAKMPYMHEQFRKCIRRLLKENVSLAALVGQMATRVTLADDQNAPKVQQGAALYEFGKSLLTKDITTGVAMAVKEGNTKIVTKRMDEKYAETISGLNQRIADDAAAHTAAQAAKDAAHQTAMQEKDAAHAAALAAAAEDKAAAVAAEKANTAAVQKKLDDADRVHGEEVAKLNADHKQAMDDKDTAHKAETDKLTGLLGTARDTISGLQADVAAKEQTITGLETDLRTANTTIEKRDEAIARMNDDLATANGSIAKLKKEEAKLQDAVRAMDGDITKGKAEIARLTELLEDKGIDTTPPPPPVPTIKILGVELPKSARKVIAIFAAAAFIIGGILFGTIVGLVSGGKDEPAESTPPTTTAPVETTTAPTETTVPETTVPPTIEAPTEPPVETALQDDGTIDWDYVQDKVRWANGVETDADAMEELLSGQKIGAENWELEAVITPTAWMEIGEADETPDFVAVMKNPEAARIPAAADLAAMTEGVELAVVLGERAVLAHFSYGEGDEDALRETLAAALEIAGLIAPEDAQAEHFALVLDDGRRVDLTALFAETDWHGVEGISFDAQDLADTQFTLGTAREPICILEGDGTIAVFDYADAPAKAQTLADMMIEKGRTAVVDGDFTLVLVTLDTQSATETP